MKFISICLLFFICIIPFNLFAGEITKIRLTDGSTIYGEIIALENGVYTIKTDCLGTLEVDGSKIMNISLKPDAAAPGESATDISSRSKGPDANALQKSMVSDKEIMNLILSLQNDPAVQEILNDPVIMNALISRDMATLLSNPKIIKLLSDPRVREIKNKAVKK